MKSAICFNFSPDFSACHWTDYQGIGWRNSAHPRINLLPPYRDVYKIVYADKGYIIRNKDAWNFKVKFKSWLYLEAPRLSAEVNDTIPLL